MFDNDLSLDEGRGRDHPGRCPNLFCQLAPIRECCLRRNQNVGVEIDHLLPQFAVKSRHYRDNKDQDSDTEHDAHHRNQRDDGKKCALWF